MLKACRICIIISLCLFSVNTFGNIDVVSSAPDEITIHLAAPVFNITHVSQNNQMVQYIDIDGFSQTAESGKPQLPVAATSIAIPSDAAPTLEIVDQHFTIHRVEEIISTPFLERDLSNVQELPFFEDRQIEVYRKDQAIYHNAGPFPKNFIELGEPFILRGKRILPVRYHPVQYFPTKNEVKFFSDITVRIRFNSAGAVMNPHSGNQKIFSDLISDIVLNSDQAAHFLNNQLKKSATDQYFLNNGQEWFKIYLQKKGIYIITKQDLLDAGMAVDDIVPQNLQMYWMGEQLAIYVHGEADGNFNDTDYIEFYGFAYKNFYTDTPVFWLTEGSVAGKRMPVQEAAPFDDAAVVNSGRELLHVEQDVLHYGDYPGNTEEDSWFMNYNIANSSYATGNYDVELNHINHADTSAGFVINGRGMTDVNLDPDHHTIISINGTEVLNEYWNGFNLYIRDISFSASLLNEGSNTITIDEPGDTGADVDWFFPDYFQIEYNRFFIAEHDTLAINVSGAQNNRNIVVRNLHAPEQCVLNVTDSLNVKRLTNYQTKNDSVIFGESSTIRQSFSIAAFDSLKAPIQIVKDSHSSLRDNAQQIDYVIISHHDFMDAIQPLADFHSASGKNVLIADIADVYDEFNYGVDSEYAIKNFLRYTYFNWTQPAPTYVLLVGDASYNPRLLSPDRYGAQRSDYVPTRLFEAVADYFEAASDNWFTAVDGDDVIPDMFIGRISARSEEDVTNSVTKILAHATMSLEGTWYNTASFVCDDGEGGILAFEDSINALVNDIVPASLNVEKIYISELGKTQTKESIFDAFDSGRLLINYLGHGSATTWMGEQVLATAFLPELRGGSNLPFVVTMSCSNGYLVYPMENFQGLAEALVQSKQKGAVGILSGAGKAYAPPMYALGRGIYSALFLDVDRIAGSFTLQGLLSMYLHYPTLADHLMFHILFGDPALELPYQPSWQYVFARFSGSLQINQSPVQVNSELCAIIDDSLAFKSTITTAGQYVVKIPADNPDTIIKDGAFEGDTVKFKITLPDSVYYLLDKVAIWHANSTVNLALSATGTRVMEEANFAFLINDQLVGDEAIDGEIIPLNSLIRIKANSKMQNSRYLVYLNDIPVDLSSSLKFTPEGYQTEYEFPTLTLNDGQYHLKISHMDSLTQKSYAEAQIVFQINSELGVTDVMNWPNPMQTRTQFTFIMQNDKACRGTLDIFTLAGRKINRIDLPEIAVGFNSFYWDGTDNSGDHIANGVYLYKLIIQDDLNKVEKIEKIMVIR